LTCAASCRSTSKPCYARCRKRPLCRRSQAVHIGSYTGEIASTIQEEAFDYLDAPVKRVGAKNGIAPQSHILEAAFLRT